MLENEPVASYSLSEQSSMTMWGGRFSEGPSDVLWRYTASTTDRRLLGHDVQGSLAHVDMLHEVGLLSDQEHELVGSGLFSIADEAASGAFRFEPGDEDVHSAVERRLIEMVGDAGRKLHMARSRNDQIALDLRLYLREACDRLAAGLATFGLTMVDVAVEHAATIVPSYTHLQQAQSVPLGHHLLAHVWMASRNRQRFQQLAGRVAVSPLGAGASGGSSLPIDPDISARKMGFDAVFTNSMDAVGARDLAAEFTWCCAQTMVDLSRLSEELILWATAEFGWVTISDEHSTGSSALPHKKNPDIAELARGRSASSIGDLMAMLSLQKGLPMTYNRDFQEDKEHVFRADDTLGATLEALTAMVGAAVFDPPGPSSWVTALDMAELLVARGVPFRRAHEVVGSVVAALVSEGRDLGDVTPDELVAASPHFRREDVQLIDPITSVERRMSRGGGSVESVHTQAEALRSLLSP